MQDDPLPGRVDQLVPRHMQLRRPGCTAGLGAGGPVRRDADAKPYDASRDKRR